jgi:ketosteroid isomerase-like protein
MLRLTTAFFLATSLQAFPPVAQAQTRAKDLAAVIGAERAFSRMAVDSTTQQAFDRYMAPDSWLFRPRAVRSTDFRRRTPLPRDLILTWEPEYADVSRAGDLGYTTGTWASGSRSSRADEMFGQYLTIWKKQSNGRWLAVFNGNVRTLPRDPGKLRSPAAASAYVGKPNAAADKNTLLNADNNFSNIARQRGYAEALRPLAFIDVRTLRHTFHAVGIDSILATHRGARVSMWMPMEAFVSVSGDLGYTRGSYVISVPGGGNEAGDYLRVWRREKNGMWRVALDLLSRG